MEHQWMVGREEMECFMGLRLPCVLV